MNIPAFLVRMTKSSQSVDVPKEQLESQKEKTGYKSEADVVEAGPSFAGGRNTVVEVAPKPPAPADQKTSEAIAERDRVLKALAEAKILVRAAREEREREYPGEPMRYFIEKLAPTLADAGSSWERNVHIPLGVKEKK